MARHLIRGKKFLRYLIAGCYPIAVDGTQKFTRSSLWDEECLERKVRTKKKDEKDPQADESVQIAADMAGTWFSGDKAAANKAPTETIK